MESLKQYSIPLKSLGNKLYSFDFQVNKEFFTHFENSMVGDGCFDIKVEVDKRSSVIDFQFIIDGTIKTQCDRCLVQINLPVKGNFDILGKYKEGESEEIEVIHIHPMATSLNIAQYIYEFISLSIPMSQNYDCQANENPPCDEEMLDYLDGEYEEEEIEEKNDDNPFKEVLKNLKIDNK